MRVITAGTFLTLLSVSSACATGLPERFDGPANEHPLVLAADAEQKDRAGWKKLCFDAPGGGAGDVESASQHAAAGGGAQACYTYAELIDPPTQILMARVGVLQIRPSGRSVLVAFLPLALASDPGHIRLDNSERVQLAYLAHDGCDVWGCFGRAEMPPGLLDRMKNAKAISVMGVANITGRGLPFPLPCCGFAAAFEGASVPAEAQDEDQRKLQDIIVRHFADFIR